MIKTTLRPKSFLESFRSVVYFLRGKPNRFRITVLFISITAHFFLFESFLQKGKTIPAISSAPNTTSSSIHIKIISSYGNRQVPLASEGNNQAHHNIRYSQYQERLLKREKETLPRISTGNLAEPYYFLQRELTEKPLVRKDIPPDLGELLPEISPQHIKIDLFISETGEVDNVFLEDSRLPDYAQVLLRENFSNVKFYPGKIDGVAVKSQLQIEIAIEPESNLQKDSSRSLLR